MSSNEHNADPLTLAELDALDALNRARTPGPLRLDADGSGAARVRASESGNLVALCIGEADARAIAAALNALPVLLAEVRAARARERIRETWQAVEPDTAPRLHIPADLLTRPAGGGLR